MGMLKDFWNRIERAYDTSDTEPEAPGLDGMPEERLPVTEDPAAYEEELPPRQ